ncbi:tafazzin [Impatiens glandulifera]|uniref:tafazzin n=1 Tax=Impatiens glandulifera TaxID=253017 RepID=UPI001FB0FFC1|nr:tafazzin [Impatiens glandulifera]
MVGERVVRTDLWKNNALSLQLRLKNRFRVAVDRHCRHQRFTRDGYFSTTMQRWLQRFQHFRTESLPSSSNFYRRKVNKHAGAEESILIRMLQALAAPVFGNVCYVFMHGLNRVQIYGAEKLHQALLNRPTDQALLTVSNHVASMDDPLVVASLLPPSVLFNANKLRWTLCATDRCFRNPATSAFFRCLKVLPVSRGDGIHQKGMDLAISKLNNGDWVHIFPEGTRSRDGGKTMGSAKRGVARLVLDADTIPLVIPFVHIGMQNIMPIGAKLPSIGNTVTVLIGDPIYFDDLLAKENHIKLRGSLHDAVSLRIGNRLQELKAQAERLALENTQNYNSLNHTERATIILQKVDWESLGMDSYVIPEIHNPPKQMQESSEHEQKTGFTHLEEEHDTLLNESSPSWAASISSEGGSIVSRVKGYIDLTETRVILSTRVAEHLNNVRDSTPLKAWKRYWSLVHENRHPAALDVDLA